jgi:hypothetical protein
MVNAATKMISVYFGKKESINMIRHEMAVTSAPDKKGTMAS